MKARGRSTGPRKAAANRVNALRSTGPKSIEGKAAVAQNAIRHGVLSRVVLMIGEDRAALDALRVELVSAIEPEGAVEELLTDQVVSTVWRLRRAQAMESNVLGATVFGSTDAEFGGIDKKRLALRFIGRDNGGQPQDLFGVDPF